MSCIIKLLEMKGDQEFLPVNDSVVIEGGGTYKEHEYLIVFTSGGHRCGYVALKPEESSHIQKNTENIDYPDDMVGCHGGVTFYDNFHAAKDLLPIPCDDFWVGFDAAHCYDAPDPDLTEKYFNDSEEAMRKRKWQEEIARYEDCKHRDFAYMESECHRIIDQLNSWEMVI